MSWLGLLAGLDELVVLLSQDRPSHLRLVHGQPSGDDRLVRLAGQLGGLVLQQQAENRQAQREDADAVVERSRALHRAFYAQLAAYLVAAIGVFAPAVAERIGPVRLAAFFLLVNLAALQALLRWLSGERLEVWEPTRRPQ